MSVTMPKVKSISILRNSFLAFLMLGVLFLLPAWAVADSPTITLALACKPHAATPNPNTKNGELDCVPANSAAPTPNEVDYVAAVGADSSKYPQNVTLVVVTLKCASNDKVAQYAAGQTITKLQCHSGKVPTISTVKTISRGAGVTPPSGGASTSPAAPITGLSSISANGLPQPPADTNAIQTILKIVFGAIGAAAILMITISGLRYVVSAGNPERIAKAKNGIIYSLVGIAVALTAEAIVTFVGNRL
jgi:hypothetical protein